MQRNDYIYTCFLCNVDVPQRSRVYFKNIAHEEPMGSVGEILAKKYSDEQIVEALGKEPVACIEANATRFLNCRFH